VPSIYSFKKPRFQALLRPGVKRLAGAGVAANQVTLLACGLSIAGGMLTTLRPRLLIVSIGSAVRPHGPNAIDGMLARDFGQKSAMEPI
jgi:CDP-diacylglycerol--glycerol-3-phosphate 3-phosphatidyltransferase